MKPSVGLLQILWENKGPEHPQKPVNSASFSHLNKLFPLMHYLKLRFMPFLQGISRLWSLLYVMLLLCGVTSVDFFQRLRNYGSLFWSSRKGFHFFFSFFLNKCPHDSHLLSPSTIPYWSVRALRLSDCTFSQSTTMEKFSTSFKTNRTKNLQKEHPSCV